MSIHTIRMPDIGEGIAEVEIVEWRVKAGDTVAEDQTLCDVMTDKAAVEVPSPVAGRVVELGGEVGQVMAVGSVLIRIDDGSEAADKRRRHSRCRAATLGACRGTATVARRADTARLRQPNPRRRAACHHRCRRLQRRRPAASPSAAPRALAVAGRARARPRARHRSLAPEG